MSTYLPQYACGTHSTAGGSQCSLITCELQESNLGHQIWKKHPCLQGNLAYPCTIAFFAETVYVIEFCEYLQMIRIFSFFLGSIFSLNHLYFMCFRSLYNIDFIINQSPCCKICTYKNMPVLITYISFIFYFMILISKNLLILFFQYDEFCVFQEEQVWFFCIQNLFLHSNVSVVLKKYLRISYNVF